MPPLLPRVAAAALAVGLATLAAAPASAASPVARGTAGALTVDVANQKAYSGAYTATNDGAQETTTGDNRPPLSVLQGQQVVTTGTLAQDASATKDPRARACAGVAGPGATVTEVGDSGSCLGQGRSGVEVSAGSVDFSSFDPSTGVLNSAFNDAILGQIPDAQQQQFQALVTALATQLAGSTEQFFAALGNPSVTFGFGVIRSDCTATDGAADGDSVLLDAGLRVNFGANAPVDPVVASLPVHPPPNTPLLTNLDVVTKAITDALSADLNANTPDQLQPLVDALQQAGISFDQLQAINAAVGQISDQLGPLQDNVLDGIMNKQSRDGDSKIHVTALDVNVLPAAAQAAGGPLAHLAIADVICQAGARSVVSAPTTPTSAGVPTTVDSGLAGDPGPDPVLTVLGVLAVLAGAGLGVRRLRGSGD